MRIFSTPNYISVMAFFLMAVTFHSLKAQNFRYSVPGLDSLETFIVAGGSSTILQNGQGEVILSNSLSSNWVAIHESNRNSPIVDRFRQTQFTSDLFGFYGISYSGKWDIGIHLKWQNYLVNVLE